MSSFRDTWVCNRDRDNIPKSLSVDKFLPVNNTGISPTPNIYIIGFPDGSTAHIVSQEIAYF